MEYTDELGDWWDTLDEEEQVAIDAMVGVLAVQGPQLTFPHSSSVESSRYSHMRELRIQHKGDPYRILYAFDSRKVALLLIGGNKRGDDRWYEKHVPLADKLYAGHLEDLRRERPKHG